jgi:hypothetical protein
MGSERRRLWVFFKCSNLVFSEQKLPQSIKKQVPKFTHHSLHYRQVDSRNLRSAMENSSIPNCKKEALAYRLIAQKSRAW